ncbi:MAG: metallophosphoesterase [Flavobacteriales bacterium]|nr:metallophosphoesterase [Flavobacteriales bacterium]
MKKTLLFLAFILCLSLSGQDKKITFAVLSDTHLGSFDYAIKDLNEAIADINQNPDIDLVIVSGDITEFGTDSEILGTKKSFPHSPKNTFSSLATMIPIGARVVVLLSIK